MHATARLAPCAHAPNHPHHHRPLRGKPRYRRRRRGDL